MPETIPVSIKVAADKPLGPYRPIWNWFGYDEPNYTYTENGRKLLGELAELCPAPSYARTHNLLTSGDGTPSLKWGSTNAYTEDRTGRPVYDWRIIDRIFDATLDAGVVPFVQVGFMPEALSTKPVPYRHSFPDMGPGGIKTGWATPPKDYGKWGELVAAWARHMAERYGQRVVASWPWEVWNEPDGNYWTGTVEEFCRLYDVTVDALTRVLPGVRVGGPHTCGAHGRPGAGPFLRQFLQHCVGGTNWATGARGTQLDFIGCHAKGRPSIGSGVVRMGLQRHLNDIQTNLDIVKEFPELAGRPVILGESDPEGCAACSMRTHPENAYRNGPLYGAYVVEAIARTYELSRRAGVDIEGSVTWAFLFEGQAYFEGFRDLATNGIDKAVLNALRMLGMLEGAWLHVASSHALSLDSILSQGVRGAPDVNALATSSDAGVSILLWHYHDDDAAGPEAAITLEVSGLPHASKPVSLRHYRMDERHSNAHRLWQEMGEPQDLAGEAYATLERAGQLQRFEPERSVTATSGALPLSFTLPRQGVSLLRLTWGD
ncbi:MAG: beta-xylosidase [Proteobacteria bacterium]|nr:beta-xylosidase [Pseudomonadota bacterium]MBI3499437.1 beta-xylosidase [Pseudomonadota bacterium]